MLLSAACTWQRKARCYLSSIDGWNRPTQNRGACSTSSFASDGALALKTQGLESRLNWREVLMGRYRRRRRLSTRCMRRYLRSGRRALCAGRSPPVFPATHQELPRAEGQLAANIAFGEDEGRQQPGVYVGWRKKSGVVLDVAKGGRDPQNFITTKRVDGDVGTSSSKHAGHPWHVSPPGSREVRKREIFLTDPSAGTGQATGRFYPAEPPWRAKRDLSW